MSHGPSDSHWFHIKAKNESFLESILKKNENKTSGNLLEDIYRSAKETNTVTVRVKGRVGARDVRDTEGNFDDLTLLDPERAYNITQTLHETNEAKKEGNIGDGGVVNKGAENCFWKKMVYKTAEKYHIFVLDKGRGKYVDVKVHFYYEFRDPY